MIATVPRRLVHSRATQPQRDFWAATHKVKALIGGVGSGKTRAGVVECLRQPPGSIGMVVAPTYRMLADSTLVTFLELTERGGILESFTKGDMVARLAGGRTVLFRTSEHPDRLRGPNLGWTWIDEAAMASHNAWRILLGRLRLPPGKAWVTATPRGKNWLHKVFTEGGANYYLVRAPTWSNPFLPADFIPTLQQEYDESFSRQELGGEFLDEALGQLLPDAWVERMVRAPRDKTHPPGPKYLSVDLARGHGGDRTVLLVTDYLGIIDIQLSNMVGPIDAALETQKVMRVHGILPQHIIYDQGGNILADEYVRHLGALGIVGCIPYNGSGGGGDTYNNRRTRSAFRLRSRLTPELPLDRLTIEPATSVWERDRPRPIRLQPCYTVPQNPIPVWWPSLRQELLAIKFEMDMKKRALERKDLLMARLGRSSDLADALFMAMYLMANTMGW